MAHNFFGLDPPNRSQTNQSYLPGSNKCTSQPKSKPSNDFYLKMPGQKPHTLPEETKKRFLTMQWDEIYRNNISQSHWTNDIKKGPHDQYKTFYHTRKDFVLNSTAGDGGYDYNRSSSKNISEISMSNKAAFQSQTLKSNNHRDRAEKGGRNFTQKLEKDVTRISQKIRGKHQQMGRNHSLKMVDFGRGTTNTGPMQPYFALDGFSNKHGFGGPRHSRARLESLNATPKPGLTSVTKGFPIKDHSTFYNNETSNIQNSTADSTLYITSPCVAMNKNDHYRKIIYPKDLSQNFQKRPPNVDSGLHNPSWPPANKNPKQTNYVETHADGFKNIENKDLFQHLVNLSGNRNRVEKLDCYKDFDFSITIDPFDTKLGKEGQGTRFKELLMKNYVFETNLKELGMVSKLLKFFMETNRTKLGVKTKIQSLENLNEFSKQKKYNQLLGYSKDRFIKENGKINDILNLLAESPETIEFENFIKMRNVVKHRIKLLEE